MDDDRDLVHVTMVYQSTVAEMENIIKIIMEKSYIYHKDMVKLSIFSKSSSGLKQYYKYTSCISNFLT